MYFNLRKCNSISNETNVSVLVESSKYLYLLDKNNHVIAKSSAKMSFLGT